MTGTITLVDGGQNYVEFDVVCGVIQAVRPSGLNGWKGTKILNKEIEVGDTLKIDLQWDDYDLPLKYAISKIEYEVVAGSEWLRANMSSETIYNTNPETYVDHHSYEAYCGEIPFYFDCLNAAAIAATNALMDDRIPGVLMKYIEYAQLVDEIKPGSPNTIGRLNEDHFITIFGGRTIDAGIIAHEATHSWALGKWGGVAPPEDTDYWAAIQSEEPPITEYAKTSPGEDLAEAVRYWVSNPGLLKTKCPVRYVIVERMMTEPNYYG